MQSPLPLDALSIEQLTAAFHRARARLVLLDYDGTLQDFVDRPEDAFPDTELLELLVSIAEDPRTDLGIVSGRGRPNMESWLGHLPLGLSTEHGLWIRWPGDEDWSRMLPAGTGPEILAPVRNLMEEFRESTPGSRVEVKDASLAWHYRLADPAQVPGQPRRLLARLKEIREESNLPIDMLDGKNVIEVRIHGVHKGNIAGFLEERGRRYDFQMALGDDATDENMFTALPAEAWTIKVGDGNSHARFRLKNVGAVRSFLGTLVTG